MKDASPRAIFLKDYRAPDFSIPKSRLVFDLRDEFTVVTATLEFVRSDTASPDASLHLVGQELELLELALDDTSLGEADYVQDSESLTIARVPDKFQLRCVTKIFPQNNTSLEGLYRSRGMYCTQCEAEGFRKITYYLDRPDVMSEFVTRVEADAKAFPLLLSNGNLMESGELGAGRHFATWHDPFKKPSYLFALVAADLACVEDRYRTASGREVEIRIFVEDKDLDKVGHAITSLKNAMAWDERAYGREYDLDVYMIVAVDDFNMGAMENKGLNIFNTSCVLANPRTTTDAGFQRVEGVVAHEYFHNWSGNRVTCRDWFQLSLKEGFTVFRDQEFSAEMGSPTVKRVEDVSALRTLQFAEDAGPMAHPVQPASFIEISNFYTLTIYEKGAEIVRMIRTLLGPEAFRQGSDLYFNRHDGQAVTIDDFVAAMADASGRDFDQFMHWYRQAGTPELRVRDEYSSESGVYKLHFEQSCPPTPESEDKAPFLIPIKLSLLGGSGPLNFTINSGAGTCTECVLEMTDAQQTFSFTDVQEKPVPSLLRGFSAPVKLRYRYSRDDWQRLMANDDDGFCRWDASQQFAQAVIEETQVALRTSPAPSVDSRFVEAFRAVITRRDEDPAMVALMLMLPSEAYLAEQVKEIDVEGIHYAREWVMRRLAMHLEEEFEAIYLRLVQMSSSEPEMSANAIAERALKNIALVYFAHSGDALAVSRCVEQFNNAGCMSDELAAFTAIVHSKKPGFSEARDEVLDMFLQRWHKETLVMNSWFSVQATDPRPGGLERVERLKHHPLYDGSNPNKIRALIGGFAMRNPINFHHASGDGYHFLADQVIELDAKNPQIASRLVTPLTRWQRYDARRQPKMLESLERIAAVKSLSKDVFEVVSKSLKKVGDLTQNV